MSSPNYEFKIEMVAAEEEEEVHEDKPCPFINLNADELEKVLDICAECGIYAPKIKVDPEHKQNRLECLGGIIQAVSQPGYCPSLGHVKRLSNWISRYKHKRVVKVRGKYNEERAEGFRSAYLEEKAVIDGFIEKAQSCRNFDEFMAFVNSEELSMRIFYNLCLDQGLWLLTIGQAKHPLCFHLQPNRTDSMRFENQASTLRPTTTGVDPVGHPIRQQRI